MSRRDLVSGGDVMADNTSPVVVGVDGSFTAIPAARWAAAPPRALRRHNC
jgi:hypothetical protein